MDWFPRGALKYMSFFVREKNPGEGVVLTITASSVGGRWFKRFPPRPTSARRQVAAGCAGAFDRAECLSGTTKSH